MTTRMKVLFVIVLAGWLGQVMMTRQLIRTNEELREADGKLKQADARLKASSTDMITALHQCSDQVMEATRTMEQWRTVVLPITSSRPEGRIYAHVDGNIVGNVINPNITPTVVEGK